MHPREVRVMTPIDEFIRVLRSGAHKVCQAARVFLSAAIPLILVAPPVPAQGGQAGRNADSVKFQPVPLRPDLPEPPPLRVPAKISECESGICGVWQFSGDSGSAQ